MAETVRVMISEEETEQRIRELGEKISEDYKGKQVHLICVLKGGVFFMCELAKRISVPVSMDFMSVSSYGDGTSSTGVVRIAKDPVILLYSVSPAAMALRNVCRSMPSAINPTFA